MDNVGIGLWIFSHRKNLQKVGAFYKSENQKIYRFGRTPPMLIFKQLHFSSSNCVF